MNNIGQSTEGDRLSGDKESWDIESITEHIWNTFEGSIARSDIREVVEMILSNYSDVRIRTYVPIFIRRETVDRLTKEVDKGTLSGSIRGRHDTENPDVPAMEELIAS